MPVALGYEIIIIRHSQDDAFDMLPAAATDGVMVLLDIWVKTPFSLCGGVRIAFRRPAYGKIRFGSVQFFFLICVCVELQCRREW